MQLVREIAYGRKGDRIEPPLPSQQRFHDLEARFKGFSGPVGSGKSLCLVQESLKLSVINPGLLGLIGAPTYPMLRDVTQRAFFDVLSGNGIPYRFLKQENKLILLDTGSEIIFRSMDDPERLRGTNLAWFGVDEMTFTQELAFKQLQARLREPRATKLQGFGVWTPNGFDWVYRDFIGPEKKYEAILATPRENYHVAELGLYDELAKSYDPKFAAQEIEGQYLAVFSGRVYHAFDRGTHVEPLRYRSDLDICWSLDFNLNPMSSVIFQIERTMTGPMVYVIDEISLKDRHTQDACDEFKRKIEAMRSDKWGRTNVRVYGDPAGSARQHAGPSDWEAVWEQFRSYNGVNIVRCVDSAHPHVKDRVNAVNGMLMNSAGQIRIKIDPKCKELIADLEQVRWDTDSNDNQIGDIWKGDPKRTHMSDAFGYPMYREFGARDRGGPRSQFIG